MSVTNQKFFCEASGNYSLINLHANTLIGDFKNREKLFFQNVNGLVRVEKDGATLGAYTGPISLKTKTDKETVSLNNKWYKGGLIIFTNGSKNELTVVNNLDIEDYLLSVVPSEIPSSWNVEALKAQAIAARSYSYGYLGRRKEKGYDLESTIEDQVYLGISSEKPSTTKAVKETSGITLVDSENKPLIALYHSSGGGYTDSIENLWNEKPSAYIQPRPDYDDNSPYFKWFRNYTIQEVNDLLRGLGINEVKKIKIISRTFSNRVKWIKIEGAVNSVVIRGEEFRRYLKLPSSKFNFALENGQVKFAGRGYGHGLGMSQWGAKSLAEHGITFDQILRHYYPGAKMIRIADGNVKLIEIKQ